MELKFDLNFAISDHEEKLHTQLGISDLRARELTNDTAKYVKSYMLQELKEGSSHYPIAQLFSDVIKPADTLQEAVWLVSKVSRTLIEVKEAAQDPMMLLLAAMSAREKRK